jgi:titin
MTAVWSERQGMGTGYKIRSARLTTGGALADADLAVSDGFIPPAALAVGAGGHVTSAWTCCVGQGVPPSLQVRHWHATPAAPGIAGITPGDGTLTVAVSPPLAREPAFDAVYYDYSTDGGATWTTRVPPSTVSPIRIGNLTNGVAYAIRVRAVNVAGVGAASPAVAGTPLSAPAAPTGLIVAAQSGRRVTLQWRPPTAGVQVTGYVIQGGSDAGEVEASLPVPSGLPTVTFDAPPGAFHVRVHAVAGPAWSPPSNEIRIYVDVPIRPSPPRDLRRLVNGTSVSLSWRNTFEQGPPAGIRLVVTSARGSSTIALPVVETFRVDGVAAGTYEVEVRAVNAYGDSGFGSGAQVNVPASCGGPSQGPPQVPADFVAATSGRGYHISWSPPAAGSAVEGYVVQIAGSHTGTTTTTSRSLDGVAPPGSYTVSVAATNGCGMGPATAPATMVIP